MAGSMVTFPANGSTTPGYLATPKSGAGPGVLVIQEWWGLVAAHQARRRPLRRRGLRGARPRHVPRPDRQRARWRREALHGPQHRPGREGPPGRRRVPLARSSTPQIGAVGFCMGGQLALFAATLNPAVGACVNFYGIHPNVKPDYAKLAGPVLGLYAERDGFVTPAGRPAGRRGHPEGGPGVRVPRLPGRRPRVLQRRAAGRLRPDRRRGRLAADAHLLPPAPPVAESPAGNGAREVNDPPRVSYPTTGTGWRGAAPRP